MSSESDDDFQSADEGSDLEESGGSLSQGPALSSSSKSKLAYSLDEEEEIKVADAAKEPCVKEPQTSQDKDDDNEGSTSLMGALKNLSEQVNEQLKITKTQSSPIDENSNSGDESLNESDDEEPPECKFKTFPGGIGDAIKISEENTREETEPPSGCESEIIGEDWEDLSESVLVENLKEASDIASPIDNLDCRDEEIIESKVVDVGGIESESNELEKDIPIKKVEAVFEKNKEIVSVTETKVMKPKDDEKETLGLPQKKTDDERKSENMLSMNPKPKPVKESKIGLKKPREKLGERLGVKKLGSRIEKKPMEAIGSGVVSQSNDPLTSETKSSQIDKEKEDIPSKATKPSQKDLWMKEEARWQQVQNLDKKEKEGDDDGWGTPWGNWGTTLISAASTLTQEVGRGVGTIMDTVENSLGVPDAETLAKEAAEREKNFKEEVQEKERQPDVKEKLEPKNLSKTQFEGVGNEKILSRERTPAFEDSKSDFGLGGLSSLGSLVSGVSGVFETASNTVLMGGLDTLEVIGRKAMDAIQDGDPGLRKKRAFLNNAKPNLASVLQDARQRAAEEEREEREGGARKDGRSSQLAKPTLDQAWEATEGPIHIEALSLVGRQCESKMTSMLPKLPHYISERIQAANAKISNACELEDENSLDEDFLCLVGEIIPLLGIPVNPQKLNNAWNSVEETVSLIKEADIVDGPTAEKEFYSALASLLAQLAAILHKGAELALITPEVDPIDVAVQFKELSSAVCGGIEITADQVCSIITSETSAANPQLNNTITNIYLQSANGNTFVQQGMTYVSSVLQYANTKLMATEL